MKNNLIELPIWCTTLDCDWIPEAIYNEHLLEIGDAQSSYTSGLSLRSDFAASIENEFGSSKVGLYNSEKEKTSNAELEELKRKMKEMER